MGFFSSKKKIYVSSVVYGMAGPEEDRPQYLKTLMTSHLMDKAPNKSLTNSLTHAYQNSPATYLKRFYRWSRDNFDQIGLPDQRLLGSDGTNSEVLRQFLPVDEGQTAILQSMEFTKGDVSYWGLRFVLENFPEEANKPYVTEYLPDINKMQVRFEGGLTYTFEAPDYEPDADYLCAQYMVTYMQEVEPSYQDFVAYITQRANGIPEVGASGLIGWSSPYATGWGHIYSGRFKTTAGPITGTMYGTTWGYAPGYGWAWVGGSSACRAIQHAMPDEATFLDQIANSREIYYETEPGNSQFVYNLDRNGYASSGNSEVVAARITQLLYWDGQRVQSMVPYQKQGPTPFTIPGPPPERVWSENRAYIYKIGSGNPALDSMFFRQSRSTDFFPFIPIRLDNEFLSETYYPAAYEEAKTGYKKAFQSKYDELIDQLKENESLPDIDYAYIVFGVPTNIKDPTGLKYIYKFVERLYLQQVTQLGEYEAWKGTEEFYIARKDMWLQWMLTGKVGAQPTVPNPNMPPLNTVTIKSTGALPSNYEITLSWEQINKSSGSGEKKPGAKAGDIWWEIKTSDEFDYNIWNGTASELQNKYIVDHVVLNYQLTDNTWESYTIRGMVHKNFIYDGKYVEIPLSESIADPDETGFIIPMHYDLLNSLSTVDAAQLSMSASNLVLNSYQIVKKKWYQRGLFKVVMLIAVVVISVLTGGIGAASVGLLGTNMAVGTALGMVGMAAVIAGAIANAIAAVIVSSIINYGLTEIFGAEIAMIAQIVAMAYTMAVGGLSNIGQSLSNAVTNLMQPQNLTALTSSIGNAYANVLMKDAQELQEKTQQLIEDYTKQSREIAQKERELFGGGSGFNPLALVGAPDFFSETSDSFLGRTLLTGSDIADMTTNLLSNFCEVTLSTELP